MIKTGLQLAAPSLQFVRHHNDTKSWQNAANGAEQRQTNSSPGIETPAHSPFGVWSG